MNNLDRYKDDLDKLITLGNNLYAKLIFESRPEYAKEFKEKNPKRYTAITTEVDRFSGHYQQWYSEAYDLIRQLMPSRLNDFEEYYKGKGARKDITYANYTIKDALNGLQITRGWEKEKIVGIDAAVSPMEQQLKIVEGVKRRLESSLFDIKTLVHAEQLDDELSEAEALLKNGYRRAAGALAGVALESHLKAVAMQHKIIISKKNPSIADYNDALKESVIDIAEWRRIQYLADLRNKCDHKKTTDPTEEEVADLIAGVKRVTKNVL